MANKDLILKRIDDETLLNEEDLKLDKKKLLNEKKASKIDSRPFSEISDFKLIQRSKKRKRLNRSKAGDITLFIFLIICGLFSALPLIMTVCNAFKPLDEIFLYPPRIFFQNPTLNNFRDLQVALGTSLVPFARYLFNTLFVTLLGTTGHIIFASMCAYPLAKYKIPGGKIIFVLVQYSLMFPGAVTAIPHYMMFSWFGMIDTQWALILPAISASMGLFLMKQFMGQVPTSLIESAKLDGAGEMKIFWTIVMPLVKPAWLTLMILTFQSLWASGGATYIYREDLKMLSYAFQQIATAGPARTGTLAAVSLIMISIPIAVFVINQSKVMETMAHSGMK